MNSRTLASTLALMLTVLVAGTNWQLRAAEPAAAIAEDFTPSTLNQPGQQYPQVNSQGYARFRVVAPDAKGVVVSLGLGGRGGTTLARAMTVRGWAPRQVRWTRASTTTTSTMDGGTFNDPGTLNFYGSVRWESGIEIPAHDRDFYALKDVPHGQVQQVLFPSKSTGTVAPGFRLHAARL